MTGLTLGCTGVCLSLSVPSYWDTSLCVHTVCATVESFVFVRVFLPLWRVSEEEDREKARGGESQQSSGEEEEGNDSDGKMRYLSLCLHPSLTRPHTVVSTMITER